MLMGFLIQFLPQSKLHQTLESHTKHCTEKVFFLLEIQGGTFGLSGGRNKQSSWKKVLGFCIQRRLSFSSDPIAFQKEKTLAHFLSHLRASAPEISQPLIPLAKCETVLHFMVLTRKVDFFFSSVQIRIGFRTPQ